MKPNKCPVCGGETCAILFGKWYCGCDKCKTLGPVRSTRSEAVKAWNSMRFVNVVDEPMSRPTCGTCVWSGPCEDDDALVRCDGFRGYMKKTARCCPHHQDGPEWARQEAERRRK